MTLEVTKISSLAPPGYVRVYLTFHDDENTPHNNADLEIFVPAVDSIAETKRSAIRTAHVFLTDALILANAGDERLPKEDI